MGALYIPGTEGDDDELDGTSASELIAGLGGNDSIWGGGGAGIDTLVGGAGDDLLLASAASFAQFSGNAGSYDISFTIWGDNWRVTDQVAGRDGADIVVSIHNLIFADQTVTSAGYVGAAIISGAGNDSIDGTQFAESISGGAGLDTIHAGAGGDWISLGDGNDWVDGGPGSDLILDDNGDDLTKNGNDTMFGGPGDDYFGNGRGFNAIDGGDGIDKIYFEYVATGDTHGVYINLSSGVAVGDSFNDTIVNVEGVEGTKFDDTIVGNAYDNELSGADGNDSISGNEGFDSIYGGGGKDTLSGNDGNDTIFGATGNDLIDGGAGNDVVEGDAGNDTMDGGTGIDVLDYTGYQRANFTFSGNVQSATMTHVGNPAEVDTMANVERLHFDNCWVALDLDGNAGSTVRILGALLGAQGIQQPSYVGIGLNLFDIGATESAVAALAVNVFYSGLNDAQFVNTIYNNVLHVPAPQNMLDLFTGMLQNGTTRGELLMLAAHTSYNDSSIGFTGLSETGVAYFHV